MKKLIPYLYIALAVLTVIGLFSFAYIFPQTSFALFFMAVIVNWLINTTKVNL